MLMSFLNWLWGILFTKPYALDNSVYSTTVPQTFVSDSDIQAWNDLNLAIMRTPSSTINLVFNGTGGVISYGQYAINSIQAAEKQGKTINAHVTSGAGSEHAFAVCYCTTITLDSTACLAFHATRMPNKNPDGSINYNIPTSDRTLYLTMLQNAKARGYLSDEDIKTIDVDHKLICIYGNGQRVIMNDEFISVGN